MGVVLGKCEELSMFDGYEHGDEGKQGDDLPIGSLILGLRLASFGRDRDLT